MASAANSVTPVTLELGGNDPGIMLPGTDPAQFVEGLFFGSMINSGQTCGALKRLYVHEDDVDAVAGALVEFSKNIPMGDGMEESSMLGPLQNKRQFDRVVELVEDARANGGTVLIGGEPAGGSNYFYPVTFVTGVSDGVRLVDEEQFGPVLPIMKFTDEDEAIERANATDMGLGGSVWGSDAEHAADVASQLESGIAWVNTVLALTPKAPFGGVKQSGIGREGSRWDLEELTDVQTVTINLQ